MSDNSKKVIIVLLILSILGLGYYSYQNNDKHIALENEMILEKNKLLKDLTSLETQYDIAISKNTTLSEQLTKERQSIESFKDSLRRIKKTNWKLIKFYKNKIKDLNVISNRLVKVNDSLIKANNSLNIENVDLTQQKDSLTQNLNQQNQYNNTLTQQNLDLAKKVAAGSVVTANGFSVVTYKERSGQKFKETDKARRVDVFKTSFMLNENPIADEREIEAFIVITKPDNTILVDKGIFNNDKGERIHFSEKTSVPYKKTNIATDVFIKFGDVKLIKGTYTIDFYIENKKVGTAQKNLR